MTIHEIKAAALELDPHNRELLAEDLLLSLSSADRDEIESAWLVEAQNRTAEYRRGQVQTESVEVVTERLLAKARK